MPNSNQFIQRNAWRAVTCAMALFIAAPVYAQSSRVVRVEEHWELQLGLPDADSSAPQVTMVMSPISGVESTYFLYTLNHRTAPDYGAGGMQVQLWSGEDLLDAQVGEKEGALAYDQEVVRWVQQISLEDGVLHFRVRNGSSQTWGSFGGDDLSLSASTTLTGLNGYRPGTSITESQVGFAENRVGSLILTKLVWETEDGVVHEQNAPIAIDTSLDP